jgi:hypothetical protein
MSASNFCSNSKMAMWYSTIDKIVVPPYQCVPGFSRLSYTSNHIHVYFKVRLGSILASDLFPLAYTLCGQHAFIKI